MLAKTKLEYRSHWAKHVNELAWLMLAADLNAQEIKDRILELQQMVERATAKQDLP